MLNVLVPAVPAMLCPPMGRGMHGEIAVLTDGVDVKAVWVSDALDVNGEPMFGGSFFLEELVGARPRFGGRVECGSGNYLVFGKKRAAAQFLAALSLCRAVA